MFTSQVLIILEDHGNCSHYNRGPVVLDFTPFFQYYFNNENRWTGPFVKLLALAPTFNGEPLSLRKLDDFSFYCRLNRRQLSWFLQSYRYYTTRHTGFTWTWRYLTSIINFYKSNPISENDDFEKRWPSTLVLNGWVLLVSRWTLSRYLGVKFYLLISNFLALIW